MKNIPQKAVAGLLCALLLAVPATASAKVTVTIEIVSTGVIGCGLAFYLAIVGSWESGFAAHGLQSALLEVRDGNVHLGAPIPSLVPVHDAAAGPVGHEMIQVDLLRWRF